MAPVESSGGALPPQGSLDYGYRHSVRSWDLVTQITCIVVSTVCISMRMYSKFVLTRSPGWEDRMSHVSDLSDMADHVVDTCFLAWVRCGAQYSELIAHIVRSAS